MTDLKSNIPMNVSYIRRRKICGAIRLGVVAVFGSFNLPSNGFDLGVEPPIRPLYAELEKWAITSSEISKEQIKPLFEDVEWNCRFYFFKQFPFSGVPGARFFVYKIVSDEASQIFRLEVVGNKAYQSDWVVSADGRAKLKTPEGHILVNLDLAFESRK